MTYSVSFTLPKHVNCEVFLYFGKVQTSFCLIFFFNTSTESQPFDLDAFLENLHQRQQQQQ